MCAMRFELLSLVGDMLPPGAKQEDRIRKGLEAAKDTFNDATRWS